MADCYRCAYRRRVPGDAHSECARDFKDVEIPQLNDYGVRSGWCYFPVNFDPVWVGECKGFSSEENKNHLRTEPSDAFVMMLALIGKRR